MEIQEMKIVIFFIVMTSAATEEIKKNLTCTEGGSITLPDPVVEFGFLSYGRTVIASVTDRISRITEESFRYRLFWNNNTGLFTFTRLQTGDSGIYTIDSKRRGGTTSYRLTVYEPAPTPGVNRSRVSADSCTLVCFVEKAHETTLYWFKGEKILNQTSTGPSLPLTVDKQYFNSSYRCVAANPADEKTLPVNVNTSCSEDKNTDQTKNNRQLWTLLIPIAVVISAVIIIIGIYFERQKRKRDRQSQDSVTREGEVLYTADERNGQGENLPDSSPAVDRSYLTTVYDKLEVHRMALTDTDAD